jgi:hypothetical protein
MSTPVGEDPRQVRDLVVLGHLEFPHSRAAQEKKETQFGILSPYFWLTGRRVDLVRFCQEREELRQGDGPDGSGHHVAPVCRPRPPRRPREALVSPAPVEEGPQPDLRPPALQQAAEPGREPGVEQGRSSALPFHAVIDF